MQISINGEKMKMCKAITITELLQERRVESPDMVSVELNEHILAKDAFDTTVLQDNDVVEFLYFMGGGSGRYEKYRPKV